MLHACRSMMQALPDELDLGLEWVKEQLLLKFTATTQGCGCHASC